METVLLADLHDPSHVRLALGRRGSLRRLFSGLDMRMRDGKIASAHLYYDVATLLGQLGLMPQPEGAAG